MNLQKKQGFKDKPKNGRSKQSKGSSKKNSNKRKEQKVLEKIFAVIAAPGAIALGLTQLLVHGGVRSQPGTSAASWNVGLVTALDEEYAEQLAAGGTGTSIPEQIVQQQQVGAPMGAVPPPPSLTAFQPSAPIKAAWSRASRMGRPRK